MKINVDKLFWDRTNILGKICFFIGWFFIDLAMRVSGLKPKEKKWKESAQNAVKPILL